MNSLPPDDVAIAVARPQDRNLLIKMVLKLLKHLDQFEHDMLPTVENAEWMVETLLMPSAARGEPILIAWKDDSALGMTAWPIQVLPYASRFTLAYGYGTYVEPGYRREGVATRLRQVAMRLLKDKGIERVMIAVALRNTPSLASCEALGALPFARVDMLSIR